MRSIKLAVTKFGTKLSALLLPLGAWGVFAIAALDGMGVPMPGGLDIFFAWSIWSVHNNPWRICLYVVATAVGSTLGCLLLYFIGYEGAEVLLRKRMSPQKFERTRLSFENNRFLALMLPAMLPPPFPFKIFVLSAAVFEMEIAHFLIAIFSGRLLRFAALALLVIYLGPDIGNIGAFLRQHLALVLLAVAAIIAVLLVLRRRRQVTPSEELSSPAGE